MIARAAVVALLLIIAAVAQTVLFPLLPTGFFRPDLFVLLVVAVALADGPLPGLRVGFTAGLIADLLISVAPAGLATLVLTVVGFTVGSLRPYLSQSSITAPLIVALVASGASTLAYGALALLLGDERFGGWILVEASLGVAIYNAVLAPVVIGPVERLLERVPRAATSAAE